MPFDGEVIAREEKHTLILTGDLDIASADQLGAIISEVCAAGTTSLVLDLRKLDFIDSSGLRAIILAGQNCEKHGHDFALIQGPPAVQRLFELTGVTKHFTFTDEASAAR
jgi:anti-sigma B factor antagonist